MNFTQEEIAQLIGEQQLQIRFLQKQLAAAQIEMARLTPKKKEKKESQVNE